MVVGNMDKSSIMRARYLLPATMAVLLIIAGYQLIRPKPLEDTSNAPSEEALEPYWPTTGWRYAEPGDVGLDSKMLSILWRF